MTTNRTIRSRERAPDRSIRSRDLRRANGGAAIGRRASAPPPQVRGAGVGVARFRRLVLRRTARMASASAALAPAPAPRRVAASRAARRASPRARAAGDDVRDDDGGSRGAPASDDRRADDDASDDVTSDDITACLPRADPAPPAAVSAFLARPGRHATFSASRVGAVDVREVPGERTLREYLSLPASEYNTLDGERVERVGEDTFVCQLGALDFLGFVLKPVLTAKVEVMPDGGERRQGHPRRGERIPPRRDGERHVRDRLRQPRRVEAETDDVPASGQDDRP